MFRFEIYNHKIMRSLSSSSTTTVIFRFPLLAAKRLGFAEW
ncbi:hypothetical protein [Tolypothrix sp. VBCCA 56010]